MKNALLRRWTTGAAAVTALIMLNPTIAEAAIIPATGDAAGATAIANSIAANPADVTTAGFGAVPSSGTPNGTSDTPLSFFPTNGSTFGILTTGDVNLASQPNSAPNSGADLGGGNTRGNTDFDTSILNLGVNVPSTANCLTFDFAFYSDEFPEFVGSAFNDAFIAELDSSTWTTSGSTISAPNNFAFDPSGAVISINSTGATAMNAANAAGTTYDGATPLLSAATQVTPGAHTLHLSIFDQGDHILDSAAFLDNLRIGFVPNPAVNCKAGAKPVNFALSLTPATATNNVGTSHTVTATLTDDSGAPVASAPLVFTVTGANPGSGSATTSGSGTATFSYTGTAAGTDTIVASYDADGDGVLEAVASANKDWVNPVMISINDVSVTEGDPPAMTPANFTVSLSQPAPAAGVTVKASTAVGPAPAATSGTDFVPQTDVTVSFAAGETSKPFPVQVKGDALDEPDEKFLVKLTSPTNAVIADGEGLGTIIDDERDGKFSCRATGLRLLAIEQGVANAANSPCKDDNKTVATVNLNALGLVTVKSGTINASTDQTPNDIELTSPAIGDKGVANASLQGLVVKVGTTTITGDVLTSTAKAECGAPIGGNPGLTGSSQVTNLKINGNPVVAGSNPANISIPLVGILHLNHQSATGSVLTQRAFWLEGTGLLSAVQVVIAESKADFNGSPCSE